MAAVSATAPWWSAEVLQAACDSLFTITYIQTFLNFPLKMIKADKEGDFIPI